MKRVRDLRPASKRPPTGPPRMHETGPWEATVVQLRRWVWGLRITNGSLIVTRGDLGEPRAWGSRAHAIRKATRIRDRERRKDDRKAAAERGAYRIP